MLNIILIAVAALVVFFVIIAAMQPTDFRTTRTARISAPPGVVFENVNDLHKWEAWSPWAKLDPNAKTAFEGPRPEKARSSPGSATARSAKGA